MNREEFQRAYANLVIRAWSDAAFSDAAFKERFISDPRAVFEEHGIKVPQGVDIRIIENNAQLTNFIFPTKPNWDCGDVVCGVEGLCLCYMFHIWKMWFGRTGGNRVG